MRDRWPLILVLLVGVHPAMAEERTDGSAKAVPVRMGIGCLGRYLRRSR